MPQTIAPSAKKRARWTDDELEALVTRVDAGESVADVAASIGKSYSSACVQLKKIREDDDAAAPAAKPRRKSKKRVARKAAAVAPASVKGGGFVSTLRSELATLERRAEGLRGLIADYEGEAA